MTSSLRQIRFIIQKTDSWKNHLLRGRIGFYTFFLILIFSIAIPSGFFNAFFFFLSSLKYVICFMFFISAIILMVGDEETTKNWQNTSVRNKDIKGKFLYSLIDGTILLVISAAILGILYLSGIPYDLEQTYLDENPGASSPLRYIPTTQAAFIYAFIIVLMLLSMFTGIYWLYSRCSKVIGFRRHENVMKVNIIRVLVGMIINLLIWAVMLPVCFDVAFFDIVYPERSARFQLLGEVFSTKPHLYLLIQLGIILLLNIFYIVDGLIASKKRTNYVDLEFLDTLPDY